MSYQRNFGRIKAKCLDSMGEQQVQEANTLSSPLRALTSDFCYGPRSRMNLATKPPLDVIRNSPLALKKDWRQLICWLNLQTEVLPVVFNTTHPETLVLHLQDAEAAQLLLLPFHAQKQDTEPKKKEQATTKSELAQGIFC